MPQVATREGRRRTGVLEALGAQWCRLMHSSISWPKSGVYTCRICGRVYNVAWEPEAHTSLPAGESSHPGMAHRSAASQTQKNTAKHCEPEHGRNWKAYPKFRAGTAR